MLLDVDFGLSKAGLATVGYRLLQADGVTETAARTTTNVVETNGGGYSVPVAIPLLTASVEWDTGEGTPVYAHENLVLNLDMENSIEVGLTQRQAAKAMVASAAGKLSGAGSGTILIRDLADSKNVITATHDAAGNRLTVVYDLS